jgi:tRNA(Ile)-lysidine synthase
MDLRKLIKNKKVIAGISGGPDSVYLLHHLPKNTEVIVAHLNHGLRGKDSDADEKFVGKLAEKFGHKFESKKVKISPPGIEEKARKERYKFFGDMRKKHKANFVVLAHNKDDNLETVLLNIVRGCSIKGLSGMRELQGNLLRPLLNITKEEILKYLKKNKLKYCIDKSNKDTKFTRNFLRLEVIPLLKKINPNLLKTFGKNLGNIQEIEDFLGKKAQSWIKTNFKNSRINLKKFLKLETALQKIVITKIFEELNSSTQNLEKTHIDEILSIAKKGIGKKQKTFQKIRIEILNKSIVFSNLK